MPKRPSQFRRGNARRRTQSASEMMRDDDGSGDLSAIGGSKGNVAVVVGRGRVFASH